MSSCHHLSFLVNPGEIDLFQDNPFFVRSKSEYDLIVCLGTKSPYPSGLPETTRYFLEKGEPPQQEN